MGYIHYWYQNRWTSEDREGYEQALPIFRDILHYRYPQILCRSFGTGGRPLVNSRLIQFNGLNGCDDFLFCNSRRASEFCNTGMHHYDLAVCEVLLVLHAHCLNLDIESDGLCLSNGLLHSLDSRWTEALANVRKYYPGLNLRGFA